MSEKSASHPSTKPAPASTRRGECKAETLDWRTFDPSAIDTGGDDALIAELITYKKNLDRLLSEHKGRYVLIKGDEVVGCFPTLADALDAGAERFGADPALIKKIALKEDVHSSGELAD